RIHNVIESQTCSLPITSYNTSASYVYTPTTTVFLFIIVDFAAIKGGESVSPFANLLKEFPVKGANTIISNGSFGPNGSASGIVVMTFFPVIDSIFSI